MPLTLGDAAALGWTPSAVRHAVATGSAARPHRGVVVGGAPDSATPRSRPWQAERDSCLLTARAGALACDRAALSHWPAVITHGLPSLGSVLRPCLTVTAGTALRELAALHLHRATLTVDDVAVIDGRRVTTAARTVLDVAREHGVNAAVVAADHALRAGLTNHAELAAALERCDRWPGVARARRTVTLCDARAESPLESLSRLAIGRSPLPPPELQVPVFDEHGRFVGRPDFLWDEFGVVGEADGEAKYTEGPQALRAQRVRERELQQAGLIVVRWGWADLARFDRVVDRICVAIRRGARSGSPDRRWGRPVDST